MGLCAEEERALKDLIDARNDGQNVDEFIEHRLFVDLSTDKTTDDGGVYCERKEGFVELEQAYKSLANKGYLEATVLFSDTYQFGDLTLEGRNYFENKERELKQARAEKWSNRRFTIIWGIITIIVSVTLSFISSHIELPLQPEVDSPQDAVIQEPANKSLG